MGHFGFTDTDPIKRQERQCVDPGYCERGTRSRVVFVDRYGDIRINNAFGLTVGVPDGESVRSGYAQSCICIKERDMRELAIFTRSFDPAIAL